MFGYVRPDKGNMLIKEYELYKSAYCALCKQLGKKYGAFAKLILNYDCTFLAILLAGISGEAMCIQKKRCRANPLKKCNYCTKIDSHLDTAAAFSVISFYYKLKDDIEDEKRIKKLLSKLIIPFAGRWRKKALKNYEQLDGIMSTMMINQKKAEASESFTFDACAEPSAQMLKSVMISIAKSESEKAIYGEFGYYLGRWVYFIDAADDIEKDLKSGSFNTFILRNNIKSDNYDREKIAIQCNETLNLTVSRLISAYNLIDVKTFKGICDNIVGLGLANMQKYVLFEKVNSKKRKNALERKKHE